MLKIDNVECNDLSRKLRSVFWTHVDHQPIQTLIDTGSSITAISLDALRKIGKDVSLYQSNVNPAKVMVADGNLERAIKVIDLPITIGNKTYFHATHVFKNLPVPLLLGDDFLEKHQDTLFFNGSTAELTLINSSVNDIQYVNAKNPKIENQLFKKLENPRKDTIWESMPIKTKGKSLQKHSIETPLEMIDDVQYLIEVEDKGSQVFTTPQLATCLDRRIEIFVANPLRSETEVVLTISATPVVTVKEVEELTKEVGKKYKPYPLSEEERKELNDLLEEFSDVLADKGDPIGQTDRLEHEIDTGNERPIRQQAYRLSPSQKERLEKELEDMLENEIIRPSNSPWSSPVVMVPKPDGSTRVCVDYRKLNSVTRKDAIPYLRQRNYLII